jgi:hypothetical protein
MSIGEKFATKNEVEVLRRKFQLALTGATIVQIEAEDTTAENFIDLGDVPSSYAAAGNFVARVISTVDALEFAELKGTSNQVTVTANAADFTLSLPQDIHTGASPTFVTAKLSALTDGYVPYHVGDATGLADSPMYTDGISIVAIRNKTDAEVDPVLQFALGATPVVKYTMGVDDSDNNAFKLSVGSAFDTTDALQIYGDTVTLGTSAYPTIASLTNASVVVGYQSGYTGTQRYSVVVGYQAGYTANDNAYNVMVGYQAGYKLIGNVDGSLDVLIGYQAGYNITEGAGNVAIGANAGEDITTGDDNIFIGDSAGATSVGITGDANIVLGAYSGANLTSGHNNIFVGYQSGGANTGAHNVCVGEYTGYDLTSGINNVFIGSSAGSNDTEGEENVFIGIGAGNTNITGDNSVFIGPYAGYYETASNKLFIDYATRASEADGRTKALIYGIFAAATANQYLYLNAKVSTPEQFTSTLAGGGVSPFAVSSTTVCTNLNAGLVDGYHHDQSLLIAASPTFAGLTIGSVNEYRYYADLANDAILTLPFSVTSSARGFIAAGNNEERTDFWIDNDGDVTLVNNSVNVVANADTDDKLCIGTAAAQEPLQIKNRLNATKKIFLVIWYN